MTTMKRELENRAKELIIEHLGPAWSFRWNARKTTFGSCSYTRRTIELSSYWLGLSFDEQEQTLLHEVAHAIAGARAGHGPRWRAVARQLGVRNPKASAQPSKRRHGRYIATCPACGATFSKHRVTEHMREQAYSCRCHRPGSRHLVWTDTKTNTTVTGRTWAVIEGFGGF